MRVLYGTSGYAYPEWKGAIYPDDVADDALLTAYAEHFDVVEINQTFYRLPKASVLETWRSQVPETFQFTLKASRRISHVARLRATEPLVQFLDESLEALGTQVGPILVQLPPSMPVSITRLRTFVASWPERRSLAMELRHPSWRSDEVAAVLRDHDVAWCISDETPNDEPWPVTASFGYVRLRRADYDDGALAALNAQVRATGWTQTYGFCKDPRTATRLAHLTPATTASRPRKWAETGTMRRWLERKASGKVR